MRKCQCSYAHQSVVRRLATAATTTLLAAMSSAAFADYRYALIINGNAETDSTPAITAFKQHGFQCTEADWTSDRDLRYGLVGFMSRTAVNSTVLILYSGKVSIVPSKSKEYRGQDSLGIHFNGTTTAYPLVDMIHTMNTVGGSRNNIVYLDTEDAVDDPQPSVPDGFTITIGRGEDLIEKLNAQADVLAATLSTAVSPPERFVAGSRLGDEWVNRQGMIFRWCPPGSFVDSSGEQVTIEDGFWLMKYEWTRGQIMGKGDLRNSPGHHKLHALGKIGFRELPNQLKRWNADERQAGRLPNDYEYALPTEAQWEYAARAGSTASYCFGDDPSQLASYGNFADKSYYDTGSVYSNYGHRTFDDGQPSVALVGQYKSNAWGFFDMHGNVSEFCDNGACRGGSWISDHDKLRNIQGRDLLVAPFFIQTHPHVLAPDRDELRLKEHGTRMALPPAIVVNKKTPDEKLVVYTFSTEGHFGGQAMDYRAQLEIPSLDSILGEAEDLSAPSAEETASQALVVFSQVQEALSKKDVETLWPLLDCVSHSQASHFADQAHEQAAKKKSPELIAGKLGISVDELHALNGKRVWSLPWAESDYRFLVEGTDVEYLSADKYDHKLLPIPEGYNRRDKPGPPEPVIQFVSQGRTWQIPARLNYRDGTPKVTLFLRSPFYLRLRK